MPATLIRGDCRAILPTLGVGRFRCCVTSPPYWKQRQYLPDSHPDKALEIGQEATPEAYVEALVDVFGLVREALTDDGTLWINIGSGYARKSTSGTLIGSTLEGSQRSQLAYRGSRPGKTSGVRATRAGKQGRCIGVPSGFKDKDLLPFPWMLGLALQRDGWYLRADNIWAPASAMPESVTDRPTHAHEYVLLLSKSPRYFYDADAVRQAHRMKPQRRPTGKAPFVRPGKPDQTWSMSTRSEPGIDGHPFGRNLRTVWDDIDTEPSDGGHVAPMPRKLARRCILAGSAAGDHVLDPFGGSGTVGRVAEEEGRRAVLIDLDERAIEQAHGATAQCGLF